MLLQGRDLLVLVWICGAVAKSFKVLCCFYKHYCTVVPSEDFCNMWLIFTAVVYTLVSLFV